MVKCAYKNCNTTYQVNGTCMFRFPYKEQDRLRKWIENCANTFLFTLKAHQLRNQCVCANHFPDYMFYKQLKNKLRKTAVPNNYFTIQVLREKLSIKLAKEVKVEPVECEEPQIKIEAAVSEIVDVKPKIAVQEPIAVVPDEIKFNLGTDETDLTEEIIEEFVFPPATFEKIKSEANDKINSGELLKNMRLKICDLLSRDPLDANRLETEKTPKTRKVVEKDYFMENLKKGLTILKRDVNGNKTLLKDRTKVEFKDDSSQLRARFTRYIPSEEDSQTSVTLLNMQMRTKTIVWDPQEKQVAIKLFQKSKQAYRYMLRLGIQLPDVRTVNHWLEGK